MRCEWLGVPALALLLYWNTLDADFAYDDSRAIKTNQDLLPSTPLSRLFADDFWGTPLMHSGSHKSYRPLCVLSFRLNYLLSGLEPGPYHLVNVVLHALVSALFALLAHALLARSPLSALSAALLFAAHPVHTEAVAGVVGRADLGACLFFLLGLLAYRRYCKYRDKRRYLWASVAMATASMLTKEHGVTVLAVCALYDVCVVHRLHPRDFLQIISEKSYGPLREGLLHLLGAAVALLALRFHLMGSQAPNFSPADNPASDSDSLMTRTLTFLFLPAFNFWLLLCPRWLSFDWSMEAIPLLTSPMDPRNIFSACFYLSGVKFLFHISRTLTKPCAYSGSAGHCNHRLAGKQTCSCYSYRSKQSVRNSAYSGSKNSVFGKYTSCCNKNFSNSGKCISNGVNNNNNNNNCGYANGHHRTGTTNGTVANGGTHSFQAVTDCQCHAAVIMAIGLLVIPFIPATNLFFYVGFVVAERVLYIPSMGFCLLVALGFEQLYKRQEGLLRRRILFGLFLGIVVAMSVRTIKRNRDWLHEENLYRSGIPINPPKALVPYNQYNEPAKPYGNLANILSSQGKKTEAEWAYKKALAYRSNMADVHYNLGILQQEQGRYEESLSSYKLAIQFRPRLAMAHLNLGLVLGILGRKEEAAEVYRHCAELDSSGLKDPKMHETTKISALFNLGRLYADDGSYKEAIAVYQEAVKKMPEHYQPQSLYNMMGEAFFKLREYEEAERWYQQALRAKSNHIPAHLTYAKLLSKWGRPQEAEKWFLKAKNIAPNDSSVYQHYGQFLCENDRHLEAADVYLRAAELAPEEYEIIFNAANTLRQAGRNADAEHFYQLAVKLKPNEVTSHMNLGAMLHVNGKLQEAEKSYLEALRLKPEDPITQNNLQKLRNLLNQKKMHSRR